MASVCGSTVWFGLAEVCDGAVDRGQVVAGLMEVVPDSEGSRSLWKVLEAPCETQHGGRSEAGGEKPAEKLI